MFFYLDKTFSRVIWHCKISIDDADHDYSRVEEEGSMEAKPVNELREELGERREAEKSGEQDESQEEEYKLGPLGNFIKELIVANTFVD